jgi:hypothetical protein
LAVDLSEGVTRNFINDLQGLRNFVVGKPLASKGQNLVEVYALRAIHQLHEASHALTKIRIRHTDQRGHRAPDEPRNRAHDAARLDGREPILGMLGLECPILRERFSKLLHLITDISLVLRSIDQVETGWR